MEKKKDLPKKSNSGFSLITVILAVGLVGILVMLIAYMVIANFRMKMSGLREKDAFYTAELEEDSPSAAAVTISDSFSLSKESSLSRSTYSRSFAIL